MAEPSLPEESIFAQALEMESATERAAFLDRACGDNAALRAGVEALLRATQKSGDILDLPENAAETADLPSGERPGTVIGPYKLIEAIGEGGMGSVWMAQQTEPVKRLVALKLIKPGMDSRQVIARFEAERQALALMDHPNIARVFDGSTTKGEPGGVSPGRPYFVMELVKGVPLTKYCDEHRLTPKQRLELFVPVCQAIQHAHQKGIIHRDIKPSNVLVALYDGKPVPKVIDFGVAKATGQQLTDRTLVTGFGAVVGTLEYMSPEQAELNQLDIDTRSDIYSLGVLLYELLTGTTPLERRRLKEAALMEVLRLIREEEPPRPSTRLSTTDELPSVAANRGLEPKKLSGLVRGELDWIVMKALDKDRNRRYETANGFAMDIQRYLADEPVHACPPSAWYRFRKMVRRNKAAMTMVAVFSIALLIAVAALSLSTVLTSRSYAAEKAARLQSEANLALTRKAIDEFFTKVSQSKLLDVPGLQPLRKDLLESAVRFQLTLAAERPDDPTVRADLAVAHLRVSVLYFEVDRSDACQASLDAGVEVVEQLRREHPDDRDLYRRVAGGFKAYRPLVDYTQSPKDVPGLLRVLQRYTALWERMAGEDPGTFAFRLDLAAVYAFRADIVGSFERREAGVADGRRSTAILEDLVRAKPEEPEYQAMLATAYAILASQLAMAGQKEESIVAKDKALQMRERLCARHADVPQYRRDLLGSLMWKSTQLLERGNDRGAEQLGQRIVRELEALADAYPSATNYRLDLAAALKSLAAIAMSAGRSGEAEKTLRRALDIRLKVIAEDPRNPANVVSMPDLSNELATVQRTLGRLEDADRTLRRTYECMEENAAQYAADERKSYRSRWELGHASRYYAFHLRGTGRPREAILPLQKAAEAFEKAVAMEPGAREAWDLLAGTYAELANTCLLIPAPAEAEVATRHFMAVHEKLAAAHPKEPGPRDGLARGHTILAEIHTHKHEIPEAVKEVSAAIAGWEKLATEFRDRPEYRQHLAFGYGNLAGVLKESKQLDAAEQALSKAVSLFEKLGADFPNTAAYRNWQGAYLWQLAAARAARAQPEEAEKTYRQVAAVFEKLAGEFPKEPSYQQELGFTYYDHLGPLLEKAKRMEEAEQAYRKAIVVHEKLVTETRIAAYAERLNVCYDRLASVLKANGKIQDAEKVRRQALEFYEKRATVHPERMEYRREIGQLYIQFRDWDKAAAAYSKVIALKPDDFDAWFKRGWLNFNRQRWDKAVEDYGEAIKRKPGDWESWLGRGLAHGNLQKWDKAIEDYTEAIRLAPAVDASRRHRVQAYVHLGQWDKAAADYSELLKRSPNDFNALYGRGVAHAHLKEPEKAIDDLRQAIDKGFRDFQSMRTASAFEPLRSREDFKKLLAEVEVKQEEDVRHAITENEKLAAANPNDPEPRDRLARAHHTLAEIFAQKKQPQKTIKEFRAAIAGWERLAADFRDRPEYRQHLAFSHAHLAGVLQESKQIDEADKARNEAVSLFEKMGADFPTNGGYRVWQAHQLWHLGAAQAERLQTLQAEKTYRQAAAVLEKVVSEFPREPFYRQELGFTWYVYLGPLLEKAKQPQDAEQAYRKSVAIHEELLTETGNAQYAARLRASYDLLVSVLKANGKAEDAEKVRRQAIELFAKRPKANPK